MNDVLGRIAVIIMSSVLMFVAPVYIAANRMDQSAQTYMDNAVQEFVDGVRATGVIRPEAYEELAGVLDGINPCCEINVVLSVRQVVPDEGTTFSYYRKIYENELMDMMYPDGVSIYLNAGDYIRVTVKTTQPTMAQRMFSAVNGSYVPLYFTYGGQIGDSGREET